MVIVHHNTRWLRISLDALDRKMESKFEERQRCIVSLVLPASAVFDEIVFRDLLLVRRIS